MAGFIVLPDGRAYAASNWAYDRVIESIAEIVAEQDEGQAHVGMALGVKGIPSGGQGWAPLMSES